MAAPFETSVICPILVGRAPQLEALSHLIVQAHNSPGQTALIAGEAGVGKSRLVVEANALAARQGFAVLRGRCFEPDRVLPYAPLIDLLRTFLASSSPEQIAEALGPTAPELVKPLPELANVLPGLAPSPAMEPEQNRRQIAQAFVQFFAQLAGRGPLLVIVEDLHWSDEASLEVLLAFARRIQLQPTLLLLTYRDDERSPELETFLAGLDRERLAAEFVLSRLSSDEVDAMLRAIFGLQRRVRAEFLEALYATTEGNPFFIEEVLKALIAAGEIFYADGIWDRKPLNELHIPRSVQVAVQRRLGQLSPDAREALTLAAVAGRRFDFALLQELTQHDELTLMRLIKQLIAAQLVVEEAEDIFVFRHALTRQAVEGDLLARERRALHRAIAEAMERVYAGATDAHLADLAQHCYAAGIWERALAYAWRAGEQAKELYAPRTAAEQFTRALAAARHLGQDPPPGLYRARGQMYEVLGEFDAARDDYEQALQSAHNAHDRLAEWQSLLDLGFLWIGRDYTRSGAYLRSTLQLARDMGDPSTVAHSLNRVGNWYANIEQPFEARRYHQEALALFEELDDRRGLAATLDLLGTTNVIGGDVLAAARYYERAIAFFHELDDRQGLISCLANYTMRGASYVFDTVLCSTTGLDVVLREADEALRLARRIGWRAGEAAALMYLGLGLGPRGEYARAIDAERSCLAIAGEIEHRHWTMAGHWSLGAIYLELLALPEAQRQLEQALAMGEQIGHLFSIRMAASFLAETYTAQGDVAQARSLLDSILTPDSSIQTLAERRVWCARACLALADDDPEQALLVVDRLVASAANLDHSRVIPRLWHLRGEALAALGQREAAQTALQAAQSAAMAQGVRPLLWRTHVSHGRLWLSLRRREQAAAAFAAAHTIIADLAAGVPDQVVRDIFLNSALAQIPQLAAPTPRRAAKHVFGGLTERERQVAVLIAQGKSNRDIGDELVVSERTVEKHVENILSKLSFTSRAQIAAWAVEKGLNH